MIVGRTLKKAFIGLIRDHKCKIGRIKAIKRKVPSSGCKSKVKNS